jgi:superfamily II DNA or RNA helicase
VQFQKQWRKYQARILKQLEKHLDDNKLHVVAAPGSGKTILELEVLRRLDKPTLILVPTITIKNQWIDRFIELFLAPGLPLPDWISSSIRNPRFLTVSTYQALHSAYEGTADEISEGESEEQPAQLTEEELSKISASKRKRNEFIQSLRNAHIQTLVVDEAHHL